MTRSPRPFRPGLEVLPARDLPAAASVTQTGTSLLVTGTARKDTVVIAELGLNQVQVTIGNKTPRVFDNVTDITVKTQAGKDQVFYAIQTLTINNRSVIVDLGTGNDLFQTDWTSTALGISTSIWVNGGTGNDNLSATANGVIPSGEVFGISLYGGRGLDIIQIAYSLSLNGHLNALADGGRENDAVAIQVNANAQDNGTFVGRVNGAAGNDILVLTLTQASDPNLPWWEAAKVVTLDALMDGGAGKDQASATDGVRIVNIP